MSLEWYEIHHLKKETPEFTGWFIDFYGSPEDYLDITGERDEYWVRRGFALMGWLA